jgi:LPXTG-site transpeptidase (sortase) family protein
MLKLALQSAYRILLAVGTTLLMFVILDYARGTLYQAYATYELDQRTAHREGISMAKVGEPAAEPAEGASHYLRPRTGDIVGRLVIPRLNVSLIVSEGTSQETLKLGPGHIEDTALPGELGNVAIAGHRDTSFRALKDIRAGDEIGLIAANGTREYIVQSLKIVNPDDVDVLSPSPEPVLTLVTCYPFYYVGHAPQRFIVRAVAARTDQTQPEPSHDLVHGLE